MSIARASFSRLSLYLLFRAQNKGNTAGIYVAVLPNHPRPFTDDVVVERNQVLHNNLPNPVPPDSGDEIGGVPTGVGIVNLGSDHVVVRHNRVLGNDSLGVIVLQNLFAPSILASSPTRTSTRSVGTSSSTTASIPIRSAPSPRAPTSSMTGPVPETALPTTSSEPSSRPASPPCSPAATRRCP